jgi:hypothetical protein
MMTKAKLSDIDREALERAIELRRDSGEPGRREQIDELLQEEGWFSTADFCATGCQRKNLRIKMWQPAPCEIPIDEIDAIISKGDDGNGKSGYLAAAKLLRKMLRAGLSRFEPEPVKRLAEIGAKTASESEPTAA